MGKKTRKITLPALFSAITVVILYFASIWPTGQVGLVAVASLFAAAAVIETGLVSGVYVYAVSSALGMLLIPNRVAALIYILFFGYYPIVKSLVERIRGTALQWILKLLVFNVSLAAVWFLFREIVFDFGDSAPGVVIVFLGGSAVFAMFDYGFTKVIWLYINRISKYTHKR